MQNTDIKQIVGAIVLAGAMIAGAILIKGNSTVVPNDQAVKTTPVAPISKEDRTLGNPKTKVSVIVYADFQCPFCGAVTGLVSDSPAIKYLKEKLDPNWTPFMPVVMKYVKEGDVLYAYRDFPFLGRESFQTAEAARCAGDQNKFWEYHDYLYSHQDGENEGAFSDVNLKSFAKTLALDTASFDQCLDSDKYKEAVLNAKSEASKSGVTGTPKGFILKNGKVVSTIDGAESGETVKQKIEAALK